MIKKIKNPFTETFDSMGLYPHGALLVLIVLIIAYPFRKSYEIFKIRTQ